MNFIYTYNFLLGSTGFTGFTRFSTGFTTGVTGFTRLFIKTLIARAFCKFYDVMYHTFIRKRVKPIKPFVKTIQKYVKPIQPH